MQLFGFGFIETRLAKKLLRYKLEHFPGDIEMWSVVDSSWGNK